MKNAAKRTVTFFQGVYYRIKALLSHYEPTDN